MLRGGWLASIVGFDAKWGKGVNIPSYHRVQRPKSSQCHSMSVFVRRKTGESRRKDDLDQKHRVADVAGEEVGDPASTFLVFGALVEAEILAPNTRGNGRWQGRVSLLLVNGIAVVREVQGRVNANQDSEELKLGVAVCVWCFPDLNIA